MALLETNVDKLVKLVNEKKKISLQEAAKKLGVSSSLVEEWADFLEEEGLIRIEYRFATPFLIARELSEKEIVKKEQELKSNKKLLLGKAESIVNTLDNKHQEILKLKSDFERLKAFLGKNLDEVQKELREIEEYNNLKREAEKIVEKQRLEYENKLKALRKTIEKEEKKYEKIFESVKKSENSIASEQEKIKSLEDKENALKSKLNSIRSAIREIESQIKQEQRKSKLYEVNLKRLKNVAERISKKLSFERGKFSDIISRSKHQSMQILEKQQTMMQRLLAKIKNLDEKVDTKRIISDRLKSFFDKKQKIEELIKEINEEEDALKKETSDFIKRLKAFSAASKKPIDKHLKEIESTYKDIENKKEKLNTTYNKLSKLIKGLKQLKG